MLDFKQIVVVICILDAVLGQGNSNNCPKHAELGSVCHTSSGQAGTCKQPGNCKNNKCRLKCEESPRSEESPPCGCVPGVTDGSYTLEEAGNTDYGANATLTCCKGYQAACDTITCGEHGIWSDQSPCLPLECPQGWTQFMQKCYKLGDSDEFQSVAKDYCEGFPGGRLVQVDDILELIFLKGLMLSAIPQPQECFWNGLEENGDNVEQWQPSGEGLASEVADWKTGEPNDAFGIQTCTAFFNFYAYKMVDLRCANQFRQQEIDERPCFALCEQPAGI